MGVNEAYVVTEANENHRRSLNIARNILDEHAYTYDEAIDLAGNGFYNITLLATLSIATLAMVVDIFGFAVVVTGATCDFKLNLKETEIILSVTFIGPMLMAYPWGFISDTRGRRKSLIISLWASFLISAASAFSPNWMTLAVLKLISTSFSSCAQAAAYTLLGESCTRRSRDVYMLVMTSVLDFSFFIYVGIAYVISNMEFSYDLGFITFIPWRFLALALSFITGLGAFGVLFFYESPKFLLNAEKETEALNALTGIYRRNGGKGEFPVKKVVLNEVGNEMHKDTPLWRSLYEQLVPLFKPPLLRRSLQLYFLTIVVFGTNSGYFMWLPHLGKKFIKGIHSNATHEGIGVCSFISVSQNTAAISSNSTDCAFQMGITMLWFSLAQGGSFALMLLCITKVAHRKRLLMIVILLLSSLSGLGTVLIDNITTSFLMFLGVLLNQLTIGLIYSYFVDLYPTSFRGMAACMCTMVARSSALAGVALVGGYVTTHCASTFYVTSALMLGGVLVAFSLPKDKSRLPKIDAK